MSVAMLATICQIPVFNLASSNFSIFPVASVKPVLQSHEVMPRKLRHSAETSWKADRLKTKEVARMIAQKTESFLSKFFIIKK